MSDARLRARSTTEIVDAAFTLYRQQPLLYILAATAGYTPYVVAAMFLQGGSPTVTGLMTGAGLVLMLISVIAYGIMSAVVTHLGSRAYLGETPDLGEALRATIPKTLRLVFAGVLRTIVLVFGMLLLIIPFFYVFARYFAIVPAIVLEDASLVGAFARSSTLSDGRKRHILNTLGLAWLLFWIVSVGLVMVFTIISLGSPVLATLFTTLVTIVLYPVLGLTEMVLYYDTRIRGEGFDLERMAQSMGTGTASASPLA